MTGRQHRHEEHASLRPRAEVIRAAADLLGHAPVPELQRVVADVREFLAEEVLPHAAAEEEVLYPAICDLLRSDDATLGMMHDHEQIRRLAAELAVIERELRDAEIMTPPLTRHLRQVMYGLYALLVTHFDKEEEMYLPRLEAALHPAALTALRHEMATAAARYRAPRT